MAHHLVENRLATEKGTLKITPSGGEPLETGILKMTHHLVENSLAAETGKLNMTHHLVVNCLK